MMNFLERNGREVIVFALWSIMVLYLITHHAIWADEARAWLIATRTPTWSAMLDQTHIDGHPVFWYTMLRVAALVHNHLSTLYIVHFAVSAIAVGFMLALKNIPFGLRCILAVGGIFGFEYAVIARNYAPAIAAIMAFSYFYPQRHERPWLLGLLLALSLNVHAGVAALIPCLLFPWFCEAPLVWRRSFWIAAGIVAIGTLLLSIQIYPPYPDSIFSKEILSPKMVQHFTSGHIFYGLFSLGLGDTYDLPAPIDYWIFFSTLILIGTAFLLFRSINWTVSAVGVIVLNAAFYAVLYAAPSYRHGAIVFVGFTALLGMAPVHLQRKIGVTILTGLASIQLIRTILAFFIPFSASLVVRESLNKTEYAKAEILCVPDWAGQTIAALIDRSCVMLHADRKGDYPLFLRKDIKRNRVSLTEIFDWMAQTEAQGKPALVHTRSNLTRPKLSEPLESGRRRRLTFEGPIWIAGSDAEINWFYDSIEILTEPLITLSPDSTFLFRLKPEFRAGPTPSAPPRIDP